MVQRFRFIAVAVLSILVLTIIGTTFISPAYACNFAPSLSSPSIVQGSSLTLSVFDNCESSSPATIYFQVYTGSCPSSSASDATPTGTPVGSLATITYTGPGTYTASVNGDGSGNNFGPGSYCLNTYSTFSGPNSGNGVDNPFTVTSATPIPEYSLGLAVLVIFMIIGYSVIRRKTISKQQ
ncbi:MAG: hypothetical protein ABSF63_10900 [Candidatus Bathyarchaeia archaeon]